MEDSRPTRRDVVKGSAAAGAVGLAGLAGCTQGGQNDGGGGDDGNGGGGDDDGNGGGGDDGGSTEYPSLGNFPVEGDTVTFGFNVPQSGSYSQEGEDELRGYDLAKQHLNNGGGWVDQWDDLSGDGVLGKTVESVNGDTATDPDTARQSASRMISRDDAIMITGGSSSGVAIAVQELCQEEKVQFQCCLTHSNDTTGSACVRYSFREMFNAYMTGQALAPVVRDAYGEDLNFYQLYADYTWGQTQQASMEQFFTDVAGWSQIDSVPTPLGTSDYSSYLSDVPDDADVLVLNHYGLDAANSLPQAIEAGLDERLEIIVPLYNRLMAQAASDSIEGIFGTADWNWKLDEEYTQSFVESFQEEYDQPPSYAARLAYTQTMQYAAAVERAGTFYPPEVIREMEDYEFDNAGLGGELMRGSDHQAFRDVLVVQGKAPGDRDSEFDLLNVVNQTPRDDLGYGPDEGPAAECELGEYGDE
ncbi:substrate-binding protein [Salinirubellus salinus]|uniref:Substrate-binding protein n=1 Tax=Salinirubellus salinus TaxID=1364945 RepID=A0A9E7R5X2_9EURY|nr:substrate-binding protein [Salinirubellus salinus]UWM55298.1 substrate-binding protein [Salinirubellus salinus]